MLNEFIEKVIVHEGEGRGNDQLRIERVGKETKAVLTADLTTYTFTIAVEDVGIHETRQLEL